LHYQQSELPHDPLPMKTALLLVSLLTALLAERRRIGRVAGI